MENTLMQVLEEMKQEIIATLGEEFKHINYKIDVLGEKVAGIDDRVIKLDDKVIALGDRITLHESSNKKEFRLINIKLDSVVDALAED